MNTDKKHKKARSAQSLLISTLLFLFFFLDLSYPCSSVFIRG
jgi:hypothetical protein